MQQSINYYPIDNTTHVICHFFPCNTFGFQLKLSTINLNLPPFLKNTAVFIAQKQRKSERPKTLKLLPTPKNQFVLLGQSHCCESEDGEEEHQKLHTECHIKTHSHHKLSNTAKKQEEARLMNESVVTHFATRL
uniref:(northern house mosquito) hypothetical protein n=1 Tax=Culex pipiens TaxID=7175 RepID=A0A8D8IIV8_CULPI